LEVQCKGNPKPNIKWFRNEIEIPPKSNNYVFESKGDSYFLSLTSASSTTDFGVYTFAAKGLKSVVKSSGYVDILKSKRQSGK
jgi:hypothetical protein